MSEVNWSGMFAFDVNPLELFVRASLMYLGIFAVMRIFRRQRGGTGGSDLLVLVMIADAAQNAMSAEYKSVPEGALVVGTLFFWDWVLDFMAFKSKRLNRFLNGSPLSVVTDGKFHRKNMRAQMLTRDDVLEQLREQGVMDISSVAHCFVEIDGHFSVIKKEPDDDTHGRQDHSGAA